MKIVGAILGFVLDVAIHGICCGIVCAAVHKHLEKKHKESERK